MLGIAGVNPTNFFLRKWRIFPLFAAEFDHFVKKYFFLSYEHSSLTGKMENEEKKDW